jgi:hypothetical protein
MFHLDKYQEAVDNASDNDTIIVKMLVELEQFTMRM